MMASHAMLVIVKSNYEPIVAVGIAFAIPETDARK
jgi:hypothetical protein